MKKNIIVTAGPTNERIDSVMKITNMSTGSLGAQIAEEVLEEDELESLYYISPKLAYKPKIESEKLQLLTTESTLDLLNQIKKLLTTTRIDAIVHSAAVGDYYGEYTITGELLAREIASKLQNKKIAQEEIEKIVLDIIKHPTVLTDNTTKISSYEKNLMIKLGLTPKIISHIKEISPTTTLIGFKLLDGVKKEELLRVAENLRIKNKADYIVANDLSKIGGGKHPATIISETGIYEECNTKKEIATTIKKILFK